MIIIIDAIAHKFDRAPSNKPGNADNFGILTEILLLNSVSEPECDRAIALANTDFFTVILLSGDGFTGGWLPIGTIFHPYFSS